jgi:DNA-binding MarR family transcriptional regulator
VTEPLVDGPLNHDEGNGAFDAIERSILKISWLAQRQFVQLLEDERFRLTLTQFYTLLQLARLTQECRMSDLAEATQQSAAALTGVIDRLAEKQLIERSRAEHDRRQVLVSITLDGRRLISQVRQARREQIQAALAHLGSGETERLLHLLEEVLAGMARNTERSDLGRLA